MRRVALAVALVVTVLAAASPVAAPHVGGTRLGPAVVLWGGESGSVGDLTFVAEAFDPTILFYRYDLNNDGKFDYPDQTGGGSIGIWTTETSVTKRYWTPFERACVEGWDGVSTRLVGGVYLAKAPMGCTDSVKFIPREWSRNSLGRFAYARFEIPTWPSRGDFDARFAEIEGLRALAWPWRDIEPDPGHWMFRADRQELTRLLGPGTHTVHLTLRWSDATFTAAGVITIL